MVCPTEPSVHLYYPSNIIQRPRQRSYSA